MKSLLLPSGSSAKRKRDAYSKILDFVNSGRCREGVVFVIYGLRRTGKTTLMEQLIADNKDKFSFMFLEATKQDTMDDLYACLDEAVQQQIYCVCIDEVTNISDFIDNSALLADLYAKEGLRIIISGTDSLSFVFAEDSSLYDRVESVSTTYIPLAEHSRVLDTVDLDDYISYGGLMKKGIAKSDRVIYDYTSACRYLDDAVSGNICRSIQNLARYSNKQKLAEVSLSEMRTVLEKMVEKYSGVLNMTLANETLRRIVLTFPTDTSEFKKLEGIELFETIKANKPGAIKEFVKAINADTRIAHPFDNEMIEILENYLIQLNFLSATNKQEFSYDEGAGWRSMPLSKEYYVIQPAVKYYHLIKAVEFVESKDYYAALSEAGKQYVISKLDTKIKGDMTEQLIVYELAHWLPKDKFFVCKVAFTDVASSSGEYDVLVYDKNENSYYAFEVKHTATPTDQQYKHLVNEKFKEAADYKYGTRKSFAVLYNGKTFSTKTGVMYLNITEFIKEIAHCGDVTAAILSLTTANETNFFQ